MYLYLIILCYTELDSIIITIDHGLGYKTEQKQQILS